MIQGTFKLLRFCEHYDIRSVMFLGEMHDKKVMRKNKKTFFLLQPALAFGPFWGFFWPEEGRRPSEGQKNPENSPKAKTSLAKAKQVFLFFQMMKNVVH